MNDKIKILLVDDEEDILEFLSYNLEANDYEVIQATDGVEALEKLKTKPDIILLDVNMPKLDGFEVCRRIREHKYYKEIPVIFLTARTSEIDELKGLDLGGNDYIKKPISPNLLLARVRANLRRVNVNEEKILPPELTIGVIQINRRNFSVTIDGRAEFFPKKEFEILTLLASVPNKVFSREEILEKVWGTDIFVVDRTVDVHVRKIREKLGEFAYLIETIKGVGYKFKTED